MNYVIPPPPIPTAAVHNTNDRFPVHRIYCVGRNYAEHAREMGHEPDREPPFFFQKNPDTIVPNDGVLPYPDNTHDVHHEVELVVALRVGGKRIPVQQALDCVYGYAVGLDMTRRDLQTQMKNMGRPWEVGKAFDFAAPCSAIRPVSDCDHPSTGEIWLEVNGEKRQQGDLNQMIWTVPEIITYLSGLFTLSPGDLIYTGTPPGVAAIQPGDVLYGGVTGVGELRVTVV